MSDSAAGTSTLTASDRCDRCGAQAYMRLEFGGGDTAGLDLLLCGHHVREHSAKLQELDNVRIQDETHKLRPATS